MKKKFKKREIEFDSLSLLDRIEGFAEGTKPAKKRMVKIPAPVESISAEEIREVRLSLGFSQLQFACLLNVPKITAISWETGKRKPSGAALRLLSVTRKYPEALGVA